MSRRYIGTTITGGGGGGTLAGDVAGPLAANAIVALQGTTVNAAAPSTNEVLTFDGTEWVPQAVSIPSSSNAVVFFRLNGDVVIFPLNEPIDCQPCPQQVSVVTGVYVGHRIDSTGAGASGVTSGTVYKRTGPSSRVSIATFSVAQGSGDNFATPGVLGALLDRTLTATDQLEVEFSSFMAAGATTQEQDFVVSLLLASGGGGGGGTLAGDVTGPIGANAVSAIQSTPVNLAGISPGDVLGYNGVDIVPVAGGGAGGYELSGPGNISISVIGIEQLVGGFFITPGTATSGVLNAQIIRINGGGSPSFEFRLYDMGSPGTPGPGVLVTTALIASGGVYGANQIASQAITVVPLITGIDEILDIPRMYELRAFVAGSVGDSALIISSAIELS